MKLTGLGDLNLSKITLGTVQFGLDYGIANTSGQPSYEAARDIIACACEGGVNCLDTAAMYGESEHVLGGALSELGIADRVTIVSKIAAMPEGLTSNEADAFVQQSVTESLKRLRLDVLPVCLLHREENVVYLDSLLRLKEMGLVRHVGVSVMTPERTKEIVERAGVEAIQLPTNVLDKRFTGQGLMRSAMEKSIAVFVRSVYLQGLILMPSESIPANLAEATPVIQALAEIAQEAGMSLAEMAMRYVMSIEGVTSMLVGVETVEQMQNNISISKKGRLEPSLMRRIESAVPPMPNNILMPNLWNK